MTLDIQWAIPRDAEPPTQAEEIALLRRIQRGDRAALDELVRRNLRLCASEVIKAILTYNIDEQYAPDLMSEAAFGVIEAAEHWREDKAGRSRFPSYARFHIGTRIRQHAARCSYTIHLPRHAIRAMHERRRAGGGGRIGKLADEAARTYSLDRSDSELTLSIEAEGVLAHDMDLFEVVMQASRMTPKRAGALVLHYGFVRGSEVLARQNGMVRHTDIGPYLGVSRSRAGYLVAEATGLLRADRRVADLVAEMLEHPERCEVDGLPVECFTEERLRQLQHCIEDGRVKGGWEACPSMRSE